MSFGPFTTFTVTPSERLEFDDLRDNDREANLLRRYNHFVKQNGPEVKQNLGFVLNLLTNPVTCLAVPGDGRRRDLIYSLGYWYRFDCPELMLVCDGRLEELASALEEVGAGLAELPVDYGRDPREVLQRKVNQMTGFLAEALKSRGMWVDGVHAPDAAFLADYPYGYGAYFYAHFLDDERVPLVCAQVK